MAKTTFSGPVQSLNGFLGPNGNPIEGSPAGSNGQVQVNDNGDFAGIAEGSAGQVLKSNGPGAAPTFQDDAQGTPGGSNNQIQVNNNGSFGGIAVGSNGQVLTSNGTTASFQNAATTNPGGSNNQIQVNNNGSFGGIAVGSNGQVLTSNGTTASFQDAAGGSPSGSNNAIQFNNNGSFGGLNLGSQGQVLTVTQDPEGNNIPTFESPSSPSSIDITGGTVRLSGNHPVGILNTALGSGAGDSFSATAADNTLIGRSAGSDITTGSRNVCVGSTAGAVYTTQSDNVVIGDGAQASGSGATQSVIVGSGACPSENPSQSVIIGFEAQSGLGADSDNSVAIGRQALQNANSTNNTAVGDQAGDSITSGQNNTCIGHDADASSATANNEITLGDAQVATLRCQVTSITALSDARDKKDVEDANIGLDFINDLRPVKFVWDTRDGAKKDIKEVGFIAQELDEVQQKHGVEDYLQLILKNNPDKLEASPGKLIPILVQAIKDLKKEIDELKKA